MPLGALFERNDGMGGGAMKESGGRRREQSLSVAAKAAKDT
jgi:hypothetical protein